MFFLRLIELSIIAFLVLVVVTQVIIPLLGDTSLFPIVRDKRTKELESELEEAKEDLSAARLERQVHSVKEQANKTRPKPSDPAAPSTS